VQFERDGAVHFAAALDRSDLQTVETILAEAPVDKAGVRLSGVSRLNSILAPASPIGRVVASVLGEKAKPVRAVLFNKTPVTNWKLGWHQDRTIVVKGRVDADGFGPWSRKDGLQHVAPPFDLLEAMVTLRVHLDPVGPDNGPLLIAPGSHRLGRIPVGRIDEVAADCGTYACLAEAGDVWMYSTPIVHASDAAANPKRRRVLQVDYAAFDLPGGLDWLGV
jgi:ectoine hydroxylase-related dioxygenase (phytanoyl-CoA dioxygenase family)